MSLASASRDEIDLLSTSAAFAMSLGAKEIFHTNFLAFLLESDDPCLSQMQRKIRVALGFPQSPGALSRCAVWREKNNRDLVVVELGWERSGSAEKGRVASGASEQAGGQLIGWEWDPVDRWRQVPGTVAKKTNTSPKRDVSAYKVLIIEAKLKSIPSLEQLIRYDRHLADAGIALNFPEDADGPAWKLPIGKGNAIPIHRTLLSISGVHMTTPAMSAAKVKAPSQAAGNWVGLSWRSLHLAMKEAIGTVDGSPVKETLNDYTEALGALVALLDRVHKMCDDAHAKAGGVPSYGAMRNQVLDPRFRSLRISDLLGKALFDYWLTKHLLPRVKVSVPAGWILNSHVNYSNGVPGLSVELVTEKFLTPDADAIALKIGVQVQNCEFRLFIDVDTNWGGLEKWIAAHPLLLAQWFGIPVFGGAPVGVKRQAAGRLTGAGRATNLKVFNVERFLYSKVDIDHQALTEVERELARVIGHAAEIVSRL